MSAEERPLPKPPGTPFGRKRRFEQEEEQPSLIADQMAMAMAEGRLDEFMKKEMPDNEYARTLAQMMMGMTGMLPPAGVKPPSAEDNLPSGIGEDTSSSDQVGTPGQPPEEVVRAVHAGDVKGLMELLAQEHRKRVPDAEGKAGTLHEGKEASPVSPDAPASLQPQAVIEKDMIDRMIRIAADNSVTPDWIMMRALKLYIEEYQRTGRL